MVITELQITVVAPDETCCYLTKFMILFDETYDYDTGYDFAHQTSFLHHSEYP